jgi:hypothetical protein
MIYVLILEWLNESIKRKTTHDDNIFQDEREQE